MPEQEENNEMSKEDEVRDEVNKFLRRNFPQISLHGGSSAITEINLDENYVSIQLSGACSGCGVSPMTTNAIMRKLPQDVEAIDNVNVTTGMDGGSGGINTPSFPSDIKEDDDERDFDAPF